MVLLGAAILLAFVIAPLIMAFAASRNAEGQENSSASYVPVEITDRDQHPTGHHHVWPR